MNPSVLIRIGLVALVVLLLTFRSAGVQSDPVFFAGQPPAISQVPLYMRDSVPPLNMLVMGKDHKIYYEAYNDASDLTGDGVVDVGYRGWQRKASPPEAGSGESQFEIDYYGYFNSFACYEWSGDRFVPRGASANKTCSGQWSGDYLNYLTMSRMDVLRRVLYGGWRRTDTADRTILQGAFFPQDAHSWGKEYQSIAHDGYDIRNYAPLPLPAAGRFHLFAVTTLSDTGQAFPNYTAPVFRVLRDSPFRVWNWLSIEGPVAGTRCFTASNARVQCVNTGERWEVVPATLFSDLTITTWRRTQGSGSPTTRAAMDTLFQQNAITANRCGSRAIANIDTQGGNNNPFAGQNSCTHDRYLTRIQGNLVITAPATYRFAVDGDDAVDVLINGNVVASWYGGHGSDRSDNGFNQNQRSGSIQLAAGTHRIEFRHQEDAGDDNWGLLMRAAAGATSLTDYRVRVEVCPSGTSGAAMRDASCKAYPNGTYKPTGILHDYGEEQRMYFGLITGSQRNNLEGGLLRRNIANFAEEVNAETGQFLTGVEGIARSIDRLRMIGGGYDGSVNDNTSNDANWNWAHARFGVGGNCVSQGNRALDNGECRMWGNPIAEMMYEAVRYFAGAEEPTPQFATGGSSQGQAEDTRLGLAEPDWQDPFQPRGSGGLGYPSCSRPVQTVISDINPSYDGNLPGTAFTADGNTNGAVSGDDLPGFDAAAEGQAIWNAEPGLGGTQDVFIGEVAGGASDGAPTAKSASSLGNIRGLAPEEPTKGGTYYAASVARYAANNRLNQRADFPYLTTFSVALASPLPRMNIPVGNGTVELLPFAKTVSGTFGDGDRKPTNTIVDFYVESIANFMPGGEDRNNQINGGRPRAVFRINYEDVEQGNDHDMDMIVRYEILVNSNNSLTVNLTSEYAAGSANQNAGYVISGTTRDGVYIEVRDSDSQQGTSVYELNTPPGLWAGDCIGRTSSAPCNQGLTLRSSRTFEPGSAGVGIQLRDPLWYAAKYGTPVPDVDASGEPNNYFLVTNPLNLRAQLASAFDSALDLGIEPGNATFSGARVGASSFTLAPSFRRGRNGKDWTGNLAALAINRNGTIGDPLWNAQQLMPSGARRSVWTIHEMGTGMADGHPNPRQAARLVDMPGDDATRFARLGITPAQVASRYGRGYTSQQILDYLAGDNTNESGRSSSGTLRARSSVLGSIVNSEPVVASPRANFGYAMYGGSMFSGYNDFLTTKRERDKTYVYVGANDGMLHAFDGSTVPCPAGREQQVCRPGNAGGVQFSFAPNGVLSGLGELPLPDDLYQHRYYVDGQITVSDARRSGGTWRTLLAGTTGGGGRSVFVLDVTDPSSFSASNVLWERNSTIDNDIGHTYGKPLIVPLENGDWGVLFGNGYGGNENDPSLYILDAFTGAVIRKIKANDADAASAPGNPVTNWICQQFGGYELLSGLCARRQAPFNGLGQITAIDRNGNGRVDTVYGGDLQGNLWKFDLSASSASGWGVANDGRALFTAEVDDVRQPITGAIRVAAGPGGGVMVFFGTGRYLFTTDNTVDDDPDLQSLYGIFDNGQRVANGRDDLQAQRITTQTAASTGQQVRGITRNVVGYYGDAARRGWYIDLALEQAVDNGDPRVVKLGERFIGTPLVQSGRVFFTTYTPLEDSCNPGGLNFVYGLDLLSGASALSGLGTLPDGTSVCTGADCGAVSIETGESGGEGGEGPSASPPVTTSGLGALNQIVPIDPECEGPDCATYEQCSVVIYPGGFVLPRPCGRQSWRQLR